ncbi:larval cuticle protein A2B-like [Toxorhynchites rutilus septentrionalis]|uniref:larval cuticle protein A2B-like n=1 Tax=Toxorhynchites rutilus septentrionalis TaxID=329112 RepID=UPI002478D0D0|nr:larval cuticle protein A2B-like [Toxorhynchites rutilus septentrionalis]
MLKICIVLIACATMVVSIEEEPHDHPQYKYQYGVKDDHTGDNKEHWEHRDGDVVQGSYSVHESDGTHRLVEYKSDKVAGFQAHVQRNGHAQHPAVYGEHVDEHGHGGESYANIDQHH